MSRPVRQLDGGVARHVHVGMRVDDCTEEQIAEFNRRFDEQLAIERERYKQLLLTGEPQS